MGVPATYYQNAGTPQNEADLAQWWTRLNDPTLSALIDTAIANNLDIVQAQARLRQARESLAQTNAAFLPQLNASGNGGKNYRSPAGGTRVDDSGNVISIGASNWSSSYSANTSASWQIDLFGELARFDAHPGQFVQARVHRIDLAREPLRLLADMLHPVQARGHHPHLLGELARFIANRRKRRDIRCLVDPQ